MVIFFLSSLVLLLAAIEGSHAVVFEVINNVTNTPGGVRFTKEIGIEYTRQTLATATNFTWNLFEEKTFAETRGYDKVTWILDKVDTSLAETVGNQTRLDVHYVEIYVGDLKREITGVIYHENTHVWQWLGNNANVGVVEGIADYVRLKAGLAPNPYVKPGEGDQWDEGYGVTARFLEYLEGLNIGFVAQLNKKMKDTFSETFFVDLLGKPVDQLWKEYKAKYNVSTIN